MKVGGIILIVIGIIGSFDLLVHGDFSGFLGGLIFIAVGIFLYSKAKNRPNPSAAYTWQEAEAKAEQTEQARREEEERQDRELKDLQRRVLQNQYNDQIHTLRCPKCGSTSLSGNKKGFGVGKAVIGNAVVGPIGLVAGNFHAKKVRVTCLNCGHQFWAGKAKR